MVVFSEPNTITTIIPFKPPNCYAIPVIDLSDENAKTHLVKACEEYGFFKVINHGVSTDLMNKLESEAIKFFSLPQSLKDLAGPPNPFGYGNKRIGPNGDVGWIEYLLFHTFPDKNCHKYASVFLGNQQIFQEAVTEYIQAMKELACKVVDMITEGLGIEEKDVISEVLRDEKSDSFFRLNHYPAYPDMQALNGRNLVGFGEHTDPQIISVLRSNNTSGFQICMGDGTWLPVSPDQDSFFMNVGDCLQVMTNGRFRSVKHRVFANSGKSRVSMIYFGGSPLTQKVVPLPSLMQEGEERLYKEFTWGEFKSSAYKSRLADDRLVNFEKKTTPTMG